MEKQPLLPKTRNETNRLTATTSKSFLKCIALVYILWFSLRWLIWTSTDSNMVHPVTTTSHADLLDTKWPVEPDPDWTRIPTSKYLEYTPCYGQVEGRTFQCARLAVPLDHFNHTTNSTISLAILRLPAAVPVDHPRYGGAILFNPGGPGGSGVNFLQRYAKTLNDIIHGDGQDKDTKHYEFISFDPRGVGLSLPQIKCFEDDVSDWAWQLRIMEEGIFGSSDAAFGRLWSMSVASGGSCALSAESDTEDIKKFVTTASVATDMLRIIEAQGIWQDLELARSGMIRPSVQYDPSRAKINYWGFSYGTFLGMTFASMYPNRISRFIIDGVVDAEDYVASLWYDNLADTEKEMESFYDYCANAGPETCALAKSNSTNADVKNRVKKILDNLIHNPLPVISTTPEVITYSDVKNLIFAGLYAPIKSFPFIANVMADIERGDGSTLAPILRPYHEPVCQLEIDIDWAPLRNSSGASLSHDASMAIACSDGDSQANVTRTEIQKHWDKLAEVSPTIGPMWAHFRMQCVHYTVRPLYRYAGPWTGDTSFPILLIGNSADPVTPLRNAYKMAKGYRHARVLEQESSGHSSVSARSKCTARVIYRYFQLGELPAEGKKCAVDEYPFDAEMDDYDAEDILRPMLSRRRVGTLMPMI